MPAVTNSPIFAASDKQFSLVSLDPGRIDAVQLAQYWRKNSSAAAKSMASRLGVRRVVGFYPWIAIWAAEGLALPAKSYWTAIQQNHLTTDEVATLLACDARTIRRYAQNPPEGFPPPVFENGKPWLWRSCQVHAYVSGRPVPRFRRSTHHIIKQVSACSEPSRFHQQTPLKKTFDPFSNE